MLELSTPDISIIARPASAIPFRNRPGFLVCDLLGDLTNFGMGDTQGTTLEGQNPTVTDSWLSAGLDAAQWKPLANVQFIRFLKDGTFREGIAAQAGNQDSELFGVIIPARLAFLDSKIGTTTLDGGNTDLNWTALQGAWSTVLPPIKPARTAITNTGSGLTSKAQTAGNIPANRSLRFDVHFLGALGFSTQSAARLCWGGDGEGALSLAFRHGQCPTLERRESGNWKVLRTFNMKPANLDGGRYTLQIRRLAGRLCVNINDANIHHVFISNDGVNRPTPVDAAWQAGKLQWNCFNVRATLAAGVLKYSSASDVPYTGSFGRVVRKNVPERADETGSGTPPLKFAGWQRGGTDLSGVVKPSPTQVDYNVTMTASAQGIDTPFVSRCMIRFAPEWRTPTVAGLELRPALQSLTVTMPSLPSAACGECSVELSRDLLDSLMPSWETYVDKYHPLEISIRRKYEDGSYLDSDWVALFKGYIYKDDRSDNGPGMRNITLTGRDASLRLQKPAGMIDHRFPPLDVLYMFGAPQSRATLAMYGCDGVQEILRRALGDAEADALNGNGDGLRYFGSGHYPLLDFTNDSAGFIHVKSIIDGGQAQPPSKGGLMFPAPYGEDAISWIGKLQDYDKAVFFYGWTGSDRSGWPVPIYGRIPVLLQGRSLTIIPDADYISGDKNKLLLQATTEQRPDLDINRVVVFANPFGQEAPDFVPAFRMAVDQLEYPDANAPERAWERTEIVRENVGAFKGVAEFIAQQSVALLANTQKIWPNATIRGNPYLQWGDKIAFNMSGDESDPSIGLNYDSEAGGPVFRCQSVRHVINLSADDQFVTEIQTRPLARGVL